VLGAIAVQEPAMLRECLTGTPQADVRRELSHGKHHSSPFPWSAVGVPVSRTGFLASVISSARSRLWRSVVALQVPDLSCGHIWLRSPSLGGERRLIGHVDAILLGTVEDHREAARPATARPAGGRAPPLHVAFVALRRKRNHANYGCTTLLL
jgi:hypothetical protein